MEALQLVLALRVAPALLAYLVAPASVRELVDADVRTWQRHKQRPQLGGKGLLILLADRSHEFRNLFYHRLAQGGALPAVLSVVLGVFWKPDPSLFIFTREIGPGLFIQHGFATVISAQKIGADCWINQQVTLGFNERLEAPVLGDRVRIMAGAIVIGGVSIGDDAGVGAGAVVTKDVPANTTVVGVPARPIERTHHAASGG